MKYDVTKSPKSIAGRLESLIGEMQGMEHADIRMQFESIVLDPETHASKETRNKWVEAMYRAKTKNDLMKTITNLYLKGARLGLK